MNSPKITYARYHESLVCFTVALFLVYFQCTFPSMQRGYNIVTLWNCTNALHGSCPLFIRHRRYDAYSCVTMSV